MPLMPSGKPPAGGKSASPWRRIEYTPVLTLMSQMYPFMESAATIKPFSADRVERPLRMPDSGIRTTSWTFAPLLVLES